MDGNAQAKQNTKIQNDDSDQLHTHLASGTDYAQILSKATTQAAKIRALSTIAQGVITGFILMFGMYCAINLSVGFGILKYIGQSSHELNVQRYGILSALPVQFLILTGVTWAVLVLRGGWFLYNPSVALTGVRGAPRHWYDAATDALSENYSSVASGLSRALNLSLKSKLRANNLFYFACLSMLISISMLLCIIYNYVFADGFRDVVAKLVLTDFQSMQIKLLNLGSGGRGPELIDNGDVPLIKLPHYFCLFLFVIIPAIVNFISYQLLRNAVDMRWSLLTTPDTVRRFMYMFVYRRNPDKNFLDEYAWDIAHHYFLSNALVHAPEDFVGMDGRLFFYGDDVLDEVEAFAQSKSNGSTH